MCIWDNLVSVFFCFFPSSHWLNTVTHSLTGTISMGEKHGVKCELCLLPTLFFTHAFAMAQRRCSIHRSLDEDVRRCLCRKSLRTTARILQKIKNKNKNPPRTSANHHLILWRSARGCGNLPPRRVSSFVTRVSRFCIVTTGDTDGLPILRQSTGLL